jgi:site-specific recombinase XerD
MGSAKAVTPHTLRHTAATLAITLGTDISTVAALLRHSDLNTTRRYVHLVDAQRRVAVRRLATGIPRGLRARARNPR